MPCLCIGLYCEFYVLQNCLLLTLSSSSPLTATCACPDTFTSSLKNGKTVCSCSSGLSPAVKDHQNVCLPPRPFTSVTAVPTTKEWTRSAPSEVGVKPSPQGNHGGNTAAVVIVLAIMVLLVLGCVFIKCKKTKSGPEVGIHLKCWLLTFNTDPDPVHREGVYFANWGREWLWWASGRASPGDKTNHTFRF